MSVGGVDLVPFGVGLVVVYLAFWVLRRSRQVTAKAAHLMVDTGAVLLDVRTAKEFAAGHLPGAVNVPLPMLTNNPAAVGSSEQPVVVYCQSGTRSALASVVLRRAGFSQVADLGSMARW